MHVPSNLMLLLMRLSMLTSSIRLVLIDLTLCWQRIGPLVAPVLELVLQSTLMYYVLPVVARASRRRAKNFELVFILRTPWTGKLFSNCPAVVVPDVQH